MTAGHHKGFLRVHTHLLNHLDSKKFEIFFFGPHEIMDECRVACHASNITWIVLPSLFEKMVQVLRESLCHVLYHWKVGGGTLDYFLALSKSAPLQCTSYGSHGTSGMKEIDYYLSSTILEGQESALHYTERLVLLDSYATSHERHEPIHNIARSDVALPEQGAIYFCPHRLQKYHPSFDLYLKAILEKDHAGHIVLLTGRSKRLAGIFSERLRTSLGDTLFQRVIIRPMLPYDEYQKHLAVATCVLDSPAYAGDLTTHDAFNFGVPVVTSKGDLLVQRYTGGLYEAMGLEQLIARGIEDYAEITTRLGLERDYRDEIRRMILERNDLVFSPNDTVREYSRFFENIVHERK